MKPVNASWINDFNSQLRPQTDVEIALIKSPSFKNKKLYNASNVVWKNLEALALSGKFTNADCYIEAQFLENVNITTAEITLKGTASSTISRDIAYLRIYYGSTYKELVIHTDARGGLSLVNSHIVQGEVLTNAYKIRIVPINFLLLNINFYIEYLSLMGVPFLLTKKDYMKLSYKAHISPTNEDLPYQNISFELLGNDLKLPTKTVAIVSAYRTNVPNVRVKLGCGYYYFKEQTYNRGENYTTYEFVDFLSTLNNKYIWGKIVKGAELEGGIVKDEVWYMFENASARLTYNVLLYYLFNNADEYQHAPTFPVANPLVKIYTDSDYDEAFDENCNYPLNNTCAEVLQLIAQSMGMCLYLNGDNAFTMNSLEYNANQSYNEFVPMNVLKKCELTKCTVIGSISVLRQVMVEGDAETFVNGSFETTPYRLSNNDLEWETMLNECCFPDDTFTYYTWWDEGVVPHRLMVEQPQDNLGDSQEQTMFYYWCHWAESHLDDHILSQNRLRLCFRGVKRYVLQNYSKTTSKVNEVCETNWNLDLPLSFDTYQGGYDSPTYYPDFATNLLVNIAEVKNTVSAQVRFDPRFEIGDFVEIKEAGDSFKILLTDIDMLYNGGFNATIKGYLWQEKILPPRLVINRMVDETDFEFVVYNDNAFPCEIGFTGVSGLMPDPDTVNANDSKVYDEVNTPTPVVDMILGYTSGDMVFTGDEVGCYLIAPEAPHRVINSDEATLLDDKFLDPIVMGLDVQSLEFEIFNPNYFNCYVTIEYSGGRETLTIGGRATISYDAHGTNIEQAFVDYQNHNLANDLTIEFSNGDYDSNQVIILPKNR